MINLLALANMVKIITVLALPVNIFFRIIQNYLGTDSET
jgi:cytochrome c oxidase assembly factor CtaG